MDFEDKTLLIGLGAPKCATGWLYNYLRNHPEIFMSPIKELRYFSAKYSIDIQRDIDEITLNNLKSIVSKLSAGPSNHTLDQIIAYAERQRMIRDPNAYIRYFQDRLQSNHKLFGEISPDYRLLTGVGYRKILTMHPNVRFIFLMRDPFEWQFARARQISKNSHSIGPREAFRELLNNPIATFERTVKRLSRYVGSWRVFYGFYETLLTENEIRRLTEFLGVRYLEPDFSFRSGASPSNIELSKSEKEEAMAVLENEYSFLRKRFGKRIPKSWNA